MPVLTLLYVKDTCEPGGCIEEKTIGFTCNKCGTQEGEKARDKKRLIAGREDSESKLNRFSCILHSGTLRTGMIARQGQKTRKTLVTVVVTLLIMASVWTELVSDVLEAEMEAETKCKCKRKQLKSVKTK